MRSFFHFSHAAFGCAAYPAIVVIILLFAPTSSVVAEAQDAPPATRPTTPEAEDATGEATTHSEERPLQVFEPRGRMTTEEAVFTLRCIGGCVVVGLSLFLILYWIFYTPPSWMQQSRRSGTITTSSNSSSEGASSTKPPKGNGNSASSSDSDNTRYRI